MEGWIKLHRKLLEWKYADDMELLGFWTVLLLKANHKDGYHSHGETLAPGQFVTGRKALSKECKISESKCERFLKKLKIEHQIEQRSNRQYRVITIVNWIEYQIVDDKIEQRIGQRSDNDRTTIGHIQEHKNEKNERSNRAKPPKNPKGLIYDFLPSNESEFYQFAFSTVTHKLQKELLKKCKSESVLVRHLEKFRVHVENGETYQNYGSAISRWVERGLGYDKERIDPDEKMEQIKEWFIRDAQSTEEKPAIDFTGAIKLAEETWTKD